MKNRAERPTGRYLLSLSVGALGVVFGDIGTSPLYAVRESFEGPFSVALTPANVLGVLSLIFWSLTLIISIKYLLIVLRADNRGEGGILALMALLGVERADRPAARRPGLVIIALFGAALMFGDGMITPAISVLSALEGLTVVTPRMEPLVLPLTVVILVALFSIQRRGTAGIGAVFGPVTSVWFASLGILGIGGILREPSVLQAISPLHAFQFFANNGLSGISVLGAVFLVVTGGEALYADMGHFGARPIRLTWFGFVLPALLLNYFGQGALLLTNIEAAENPFFMLAPVWARIPLVLLATAATVIASQAVISGAFSLARQAVQFGYLPRLAIKHTSSREIGQIYVPAVNWMLLIFAVALVLGFGSSSSLAAAYGIAVSATMFITTILLFHAMRRVWHLKLPLALGISTLFGLIDLGFLGANMVKVLHGGWFPLTIGVLGYILMSTWRRGRELLGQRLSDLMRPYEDFARSVESDGPARVPGTAVFLTSNPKGIPPQLVQNLKHNRVLHERIVLLTIVTKEVPRVDAEQRVVVHERGKGIWRVVASFGFMEQPRVSVIIAACKSLGFDISDEDTAFFVGSETLLPTRRPGMPLWREWLFALQSRNAQRATASFGIPADQAIEIGMQIEL